MKLTKEHLLTRTADELLSVSSAFGLCGPGLAFIQAQGNIGDMLLSLTNTGWMMWGLIHLGYDTDELVDLMVAELESPDTEEVQRIKTGTIDMRASAAFYLFQDEDLCDIARTYINSNP